MNEEESTTFHEADWDRVLTLIDALHGLPSEELATRLLALQEAGEPGRVLERVRLHLQIPVVHQELPPDTIIGGEYRIVGRLGSGGMGIVYEAVLEKTGQTVALKMIHPGLILEDSRPRFMREMKTLGRLDHPGIVSIRHAGSHTFPATGLVSEFFTMDRISGQRLHEYMQLTQAPLADKLRIIRDVAIAVQYAHDREVIHRDLKPANMIIRSDGRAMIFDFGLASAIHFHDEGRLEFSAEGTPPYMAPEQAMGATPSPAADIYSLGSILYEMLSGEPLYRLDKLASYQEKLQLVRSQALRRPLQFPDGPRALCELVGKALEMAPEDRFASAAAFARAVNRLLPAHLVNDPPHKWHPAAGVVIPATDWVLEERLGDGTHGQVWLARNRAAISATEQTLIPPPRVYKFCALEEAARSLRREYRVFRVLKAATTSRRPLALEAGEPFPGIVPIEGWSLDDTPYYIAMKWIPGAVDLEVWMEQREGETPLLTDPSVGILCAVAEALQFAHENGIIHRDIKPDNILVRADPNVPGGVRAWLMDFGLADIDETALQLLNSRSFSSTGHQAKIVGTPDYIAPEIKRGHPATTRSDLYSLGVVLYRLLCRDPKAPLLNWKERIEDPFLQADLARLLADDPDDRFPSAGELAASLRDLPRRHEAAAEQKRLEAERETARQTELVAVKKAAYRRGVMRTSAYAAAVIGVMAALAWFSYDRFHEAKRTASKLRLAEVQAVHSSLQPNRRDQMLKRIREADGDYAQEDLIGFRNQAMAAFGIPVLPQNDGVRIGAAAPGAYVARGGHWLCWAEESTVQVAKVEDMGIKTTASIILRHPAVSCVVAEGGEIGAALTESGELTLFDENGITQELSGDFATTGLGVYGQRGRQHKLAAVAGRTGQVFLFQKNSAGWAQSAVLGRQPPALEDATTNEPVDLMPMIHSAEIIVFSPNGDRVAIAGQNSITLTIWDTSSGKQLCRCENHSIPRSVVWDGVQTGVIWALLNDGSLNRWDVATPTVELMPSTLPLSRKVGENLGEGAWLDVSLEDPALLCSAGGGRRAILSTADLSIHDRDALAIVARSGFAEEGKLWSIDAQGVFRITTPPQLLRGRRLGSAHAVSRLTASEDGRLIAGSCSTSVFVADEESNSMALFPARSLAVGVAFSQKADELYASSVTDLELWKCARTEAGKTVIHSPDRNPKYASGADVAVCDIQGDPWLVLADGASFTAFTRRLKDRVTWSPPGDGLIRTLCSSPSVDWFALARFGSHATELYFPASQSMRALPPREEDIEDLLISADGLMCLERTANSIILSESKQGIVIEIFPLPSPVPSPQRLGQTRNPIAMTRDKSLIAAVDSSKQICLFRQGTQTPLVRWELPHATAPTALIFTASGNIAVGSADGHVWVWDLPSIRGELRSLKLDWDPPTSLQVPEPAITVTYSSEKL